MNNNETCIHGGVLPVSLLAELHPSQAGSGRHRCPTCAYEQGFNLGSSSNWHSYEEYISELTDKETCPTGSVAPTHILSVLGENQGGTGRHKCTNCAFKQGFQTGLVTNGINKALLEIVPAPSGLIESPSTSIASNIDFIDKEIRNKHLGLIGELSILENEIAFLKSNGRADLAAKVEHVSLTKGDGLGYDILSYDLQENEKFIEVKTSRSDISRPFYITRNELEISSKNPDKYFLYRLFDFETKSMRGKYYIIQGDMNTALNLASLVLLAYPKAKNNDKETT